VIITGRSTTIDNISFGVVGLDKAEALGRTLRRYALASDHFQPAITSGALLAGMHVAAIQANGER